jgi:predicted ATPase
MERSANLETVRHLEKGLALLETLPETTERSQQELALRMPLGLALMATQGFGGAGVERTFVRARTLCRELGDTPELFPVLYGLWWYHVGRADRQATPELSEELLRLAETTDDPALLLMAHVAIGLTSVYAGNHQRGCESLAHTLALYDPERHRSLALAYATDPAVLAYAFTAMSLLSLGYIDQAHKSALRAIAWAEEIAHPQSLVLALSIMCGGRCMRGELEESEGLNERVVALSTEQAFPWWLGLGIMRRGCLRVQRGHVAEGINQFREGLTLYRAIGNRTNLPAYLALFASVLLKVGRAKEGLAAVEEGLALAQSQLDTWFEADLHRLRGELLLLDNADPEAAEACFRQALAVAREQSAKFFELRAAMSLARLWQSQGKQKQARELLAPVYGWFTEGFDTQDLKAAKALLQELS